jgi:hypothetical protein
VDPTNIVPSIPKVYEVLPKNNFLETPWNGSEASIEFELPRECGKIVDQVLQMDVSWKTTASGSVQLTPTTFWFKQVQVFYDGEEVENVFADDVHNETINWCSDQQFATIKDLVNVATDGGLKTAATSATSYGTAQRFYLPLWANCINSAQVVPAGFRGTWKYRLTFASNIATAASSAGAAIKLENPKLYVVEADVGDAMLSSIVAAHESSLTYKTVRRNRFTTTVNTVNNDKDSTVVLSGLASDSAALNVYLKPDSSAPADFLVRKALKYVQLRDGANKEITVQLPADLLEAFIMPTQFPLASGPLANTNGNHYLLAFASNLLTVLETGQFLGGIKMDANMRLVYCPKDSISNSSHTLCATSYDYATWDVRNGKPQFSRTA